MQLHQLALVAEKLEPVVATLCERLGIEVAFNDPGVAIFGLENAVMPVGETFLEVVSPTQVGTTAGRYLDRRGGDGGYMVILPVDDLAPCRARAEAADVRIAWEGGIEATPDSPAAWQGIHLHPGDTGGAILSFDRPDPPESWIAAGLHWRDHIRTNVVQGLRAAELQSDHPDALATRWSEILGRPIAGNEIALDRGFLRFVRATDGRPEGLSAIEIAASDPARVGEAFEAGGVHFRLV
jgi:hypothetical protein